jgi:exodeoxyribonuclease VII large subunit
MEQLSLHGTAMTLLELNSLVKAAVSGALPDLYWVIAEIAELKLNQKGHCYMDLVEKEDNRTIAQMKATVWAYEYRTLSRKFETSAKTPLKQGIKALLQVAVNFHEVYGLSLNIKDIDPAYTVGETELRKKEIVERLRKEGIIDLNRGISLPLVPQRIAIISSPTAAGYGDFTEHLEKNPYGYKFYHTIFPALMQGEDSEKSVLAAFDAIEKQKDNFDVAALIRGGGSAADLGCFDNYAIAARIARFSLPVITGIGHEKDDTISDIVAHTKMKTPTAVAEFLISGVGGFAERISALEGSVGLYAARLLSDSSNVLNLLTRRFTLLAAHVFTVPQGRLDELGNRLSAGLKQFFQIKTGRLAAAEQAVRLLDPAKVLERGYSITRYKGKALKDSSIVPNGAIIITELYKGRLGSIVSGQGGTDGKTEGA